MIGPQWIRTINRAEWPALLNLKQGKPCARQHKSTIQSGLSDQKRESVNGLVSYSEYTAIIGPANVRGA